MTKRAAERKWIRTPVKLYSSKFGEFSGASQNISDSGVFIQIAPFIGLESKDEQKLVFVNSANTRVVLNVRYVRSTEQGIAFEFIDYETGGIRYPLSDLRSLWNIHKTSRSSRAVA